MNELEKAHYFIETGQIDKFFDYMEGKLKSQYIVTFVRLRAEFVDDAYYEKDFYHRLKVFAHKLLSSEKYNFLSDEEPTDEQLERLLKNALLDAKYKTQHNTWTATNPS